jgi:hypothetical protein
MVVVTVMPSTVVVDVEFKSLQLPFSIVVVVLVTDGPAYGTFVVVLQLQVLDLLHPVKPKMATTAIRINTFFILI